MKRLFLLIFLLITISRTATAAHPLETARQLIGAGRYQEAEKLLGSFKADGEMEPYYLYLQGLLLANSGRGREALPLLERAAAAKAGQLEFQLVLIQVYRQERNYQKALALIEQNWPQFAGDERLIKEKIGCYLSLNLYHPALELLLALPEATLNNELKLLKAHLYYANGFTNQAFSAYEELFLAGESRAAPYLALILQQAGFVNLAKYFTFSG